MSETESTPPVEEKGIPRDWRQRLKEMGKVAFERAEMERLGFWPLDNDTAAKTDKANSELKELQEQLVPLRRRTRELEAEIAKNGNVSALLAEVRTKRIERVKQERSQRKIRKAQERGERAEQDKQWRAQTIPHLGREVSRGLLYEGGDDAKLQTLGLSILHTAEEVAQSLKISTGQLAWLTYHRGAATIDHYHHFTIPKKSGGQRQISAPRAKLRAAQSWLLQEIVSRVPVHSSAAAFRPGINIADNARQHNGAAVVLRIDLKDFFPSITFARVKRLFGQLGYNEGVATLFTLLSTEAPRVEMSLDGAKYFVAVTERFLPQGACTSPAITNLLCRQLDARLLGAADRYGFRYTRYADDLVFSSPDNKAKVLSLRELVTQIIEDEKFVINVDKTAIMRQHRRQTVTGLVINSQSSDGAPRLSRDDLRRFRAFLHQYEKLGREAMSEKLGRDSLSYAQGYLSFIHMVSPQQESKICARHPWLERRLKTEG